MPLPARANVFYANVVAASGFGCVSDAREYQAVRSADWAGGFAIPVLLFAGRPATVAGLIIPGFVRISVDRIVSGWARAHVIQKILKY
jgi:hypothetical protein